MFIDSSDHGRGLYLLSKDTADSSYLMHYRVGGEKKGVRRWQNEDRTLTPAGREHYAEMYGWGKNKRGRKRSFEQVAENKTEFRKLLKSQHEAYANGQVEAGRQIDNKIMNAWDEMERKQNKYGITSSEGKFENNAYAAINDRKALHQVIKAIDRIPDEELDAIVPLDERKALFDQTRHCQNLYDDYAYEYIDKHGEFDGDEDEFQERLRKTYPEYEEERAVLDKQIAKFVKDVIRLTNDNPEMQNLKLPHKYLDYFDEVSSPTDDKPWYKMAHVSAFMVARILTEAVDAGFIYPNMFIEYTDENGKDLGNPIIAAMEKEK